MMSATPRRNSTTTTEPVTDPRHDDLIGLLVVIAVALVMVGLAFLAIRIRRSGSAGPAVGAAMAAYDEAMHATAYDAFVEVQAQADRKIPSPAADDPLKRKRRSGIQPPLV